MTKAGSSWLAALLSLVFGCAASAQQHAIECRAEASPQPIRTEGVAELLSDIEIICIADRRAATNSLANIQLDLTVRLNVAVGNNVGFGAGDSVTDAVLVVQGNECPTPSPTGSTFGSCGAQLTSVQDPQYGQRPFAHVVTWRDVTLPFESIYSGGQTAAAVRLKVQGLRGNATQLAVSDAAGPPLTAAIEMDSAVGVILRNAVLTLGFPASGLRLTAERESSEFACSASNRGTATLRLTEGFAGAFSSATNSPATRVVVAIEEVPSGIEMRVPMVSACGRSATPGPLGDASGTLRLGLVRGADERGLGGSPATGLGLDAESVAVSLNDGQSLVVYEVLTSDPSAIEECFIPVEFSTQESGVSNARANVTATFGPLADDSIAAGEAAGPAYLPSPSGGVARLDLQSCGTTLLFPFVSNQAGFDTGIVISHGSQRVLAGEVSEQSGGCDLYYYGSDATSADILLLQHTTALAPGDQIVFTLSGGNPAQNVQGTDQFVGYLIADCRYPGARGYAFISDGFGGIADLAMGYIAPVVQVDSNGKRRVAREVVR